MSPRAAPLSSRRAALLCSVAGLLVAVAGCGLRPCKADTIFVVVSYDTDSARADGLDITLLIDGRRVTSTVARPAAAQTTVEVAFAAGYPAGAAITVDVVARLGMTRLGVGQYQGTVGAGCQRVELTVTAGAAAPCASAADCEINQSCQLAKRRCVGMCGAGHSECNGGCCDGSRCVSGITDPLACGGDGKACVKCGAGTPACTGGTCTRACIVGVVACGDGFCCDATGACVAVGDGACGKAAGACTSCVASPSGPRCDLKSGTCGCATAADCPKGQACKGGTCGLACDGGAPCNGGCCDSKLLACVAGTASDQCALGKVLCESCVDKPTGTRCLKEGAAAGMCACSSALDCPAADGVQAGKACDPNTRLCAVGCDRDHPCNGGCCTLAQGGVCQPGTADDVCGGNGGLCDSCENAFQKGDNGRRCIAARSGGFCGCNDITQCPQDAVLCDPNLKTCVFNCAMAPCKTGCCGANSRCQAGTTPGACGAAGQKCVDCAANPQGQVCLPNSGVCGCNLSIDCPIGTSCNTLLRRCEAACGDNNHSPCNRGCCDPMNRQCSDGKAAAACFGGSSICVSCSGSNNNRRCLGRAQAPFCGCETAADCASYYSCNTVTHQCEDRCGDADHTACQGSCCDMMGRRCTGGPSSNSNCGPIGGICARCGAYTPTCVNAMCINLCSTVGQGAPCGRDPMSPSIELACCNGMCVDPSYQRCGARCVACPPCGCMGATCGADNRCRCCGN